MWSGILVSFRLEQSTTLDSQRHLGGHTGSLLQALLRRVSSVPEWETMQTLLEDNAISLASRVISPLPAKLRVCSVSRPKRHSPCLNSNPRCTSEHPATFLLQRREMNGEGAEVGGRGPAACYFREVIEWEQWGEKNSGRGD